MKVKSAAHLFSMDFTILSPISFAVSTLAVSAATTSDEIQRND